MRYPEDKLLIRGIKNEQRRSYEQAYRKYYNQLVRFAKKYVKSSSLSQDAVQDVFIKLWQSREDLNEGHSLKAFLYTTLKNHILNLIRDSHSEIYEEYEPCSSFEEGRSKIEEKLFYKEYRLIAQKAVNQLSEKRRRVFKMKRDTNLSNNQIAKKLDISVSTVKSQYYRGTQIVKDYLRRHIDIT